MIMTFLALGVMTGGLYALIAIGLNLIFGVSRFINVAHGEMLMLGAYAAFVFAMAVGAKPFVGVPVAFLFVFAFAWLIARFLIVPISIDGRIDEKRGLVLTLGLSMTLVNLVLAAFGPDYQRVSGALLTGIVQVGPLTLQAQRLAVFLASVALTAGLYLFLRFTLTGMAIRATAENPAAAEASGIDIRRILILTFALGSAIAGAAGAFVAPLTYAYPTMGLSFTLIAFSVVIVGGLGNLWGGLFAGYIIGIAESLSVLLLPSGYNAVVGPVMMLLVLVLRPAGLFSRKTRVA